jgi:glucose/arabinose dehydrogenase
MTVKSAALVALGYVALACTEDPLGYFPPPPVPLALDPVTTALAFPLALTFAPGDSARMFVAEKGGAIRVIRNDSLLAAPFLDIAALVSTGGEQGLLGLAFDPNYATNGRFYVSYTDTSGDTQIVRYLVSANPDSAVPTPDLPILFVNQPYDNHNGGGIAFGLDGKLYVALGDGGSGGDPQGHGQDRTELLGSFLRLDVSGGGGYTIPGDNPYVGQAPIREELWNYGLRNPWRFSFDRATGDLYIGDVGQGAREEIDVATAASGGGKGANYGWNIMEGASCYPPGSNCTPGSLTLPAYDYANNGTTCAVTGGYVYRGPAIPSLQGFYFFADYCAGWVRSFRYTAGARSAIIDWPALRPGGAIPSFGEDARGELYILTAAGGVYRMVPGP